MAPPTSLAAWAPRSVSAVAAGVVRRACRVLRLVASVFVVVMRQASAGSAPAWCASRPRPGKAGRPATTDNRTRARRGVRGLTASHRPTHSLLDRGAVFLRGAAGTRRHHKLVCGLHKAAAL